MRRLLTAVPYLFLALAVGVGGWLAWDTVGAVREANEPGTTVALETTTSTAAVTTTSSTSTSTSTSTTTTLPTSALDGIVIFTSDTCPECPFLRVRLQNLAGEVPLWVRPPEEGITILPTVLVQFGGQVVGRWEGQVAVNSAEVIARLAGERWPEWLAFSATSTTTLPGGSTATLPIGYTTFNWGGEPAEPGLLWCGGHPVDDPVEGMEVCYVAVFIGTPYVSIVEFGGGATAEAVVLPISTTLPTGDSNEEGALFAMLSSDLNLVLYQSGVWLPFDPDNPEPIGGSQAKTSVPIAELMTSYFRPDRLYPLSLVTKINPTSLCGSDQNCFMAWDTWYKPMVEEYNAPLVDCLKVGRTCGLPMEGRVGFLGAVYATPDYNPEWLH